MKAQRIRVLTFAAWCLGSAVVSAGTVNAVFNSAADVPVTTNGYTATGNTVNFTLNFAPDTGVELMVVKNTALDFINGTFANLTNGQPVALGYGGTTYSFVANYYGGSGNDLVLAWANKRAFAWGNNSSGQLDNNTTTNRLTPGPVTATGVLAGKTVVALAAGDGHSLALCADGTLAAWGLNLDGQLGDNGAAGTSSRVPVAVSTAPGISALYGKRVVAIAAGGAHSLALCSDGTLAAWGNNFHGQLGDNTSRTNRLAPVAVNTNSGASALYGKRVVATTAGYYHTLALCSDGTVAAWGWNLSGQLGDNTYRERLVPVPVNAEAGVSALYGETVVAVAAGGAYSFGLCSNGTVVAWGAGGLVGDNTATDRLVPVAVNTDPGVSALYGKTVAGIAGGYNHSLVLCSDGTVAAWGDNYRGQLGDNTSLNNRLAPVAVDTAEGVSALYGKTVAAIAAGNTHSLALCSDGTPAAWGFNNYGELGDNTTTRRPAPVLVNTNLLAAGERFVRVASGPGAYHNLALVAVPPPPAEINVTGNGLTITNHDAIPSALDGTDFGTAVLGGGTAVRTFTLQNTGAILLNLTGTPRVAVSGPEAADFTVTLQPSSPVAGITGATTFQVAFTPSAGGTRAAVLSIASDDVDRNPYDFAIQGTGSNTLWATYITGVEVPVLANGFAAAGNTVNFALNFPPVTGTELMVVQNTGLDFIRGTFDNLTNGQVVVLNYGTTLYSFVANYYGGTGNDLVLTWANNRVFGWGYNYYGQLGRGSATTTAPYGIVLPGAVTATGVLMGKAVVALAAGGYHSLALCSDGTLAAWGRNPYGQLGDNSQTDRFTPVAVNTASGVSALYGKRVVAIAAGESHSLALCADGTVAAWGANDYGQLGDNSTTNRRAPVAVNTVSNLSALHGKTVTVIKAGESHSLALCSDGTVAAWGHNDYGQLGDNGASGDRSLLPLAVNTESNAVFVSALHGKAATALAAGYGHSLALCSDGTVAAWGDNDFGQLGDNTTIRRLVPSAVNTNSGTSALYGKTVTAIMAAGLHSLALCSNGTVVAWGRNVEGELGDNTVTQRNAPVAVNASPSVSALYGRTVTTITAGYFHSAALCADRTEVAWGWNYFGQIGDNTMYQRNVPVAVNTNQLPAGQRFAGVAGGASAYHTLALVAVPPISQIILTGPTTLSNGSFRFSFTNTPGAAFVVLTATNPTLPASNWTSLAGLTEVSPGQFQFTDSQATNNARRFYRVRSP